MPVTPAFTTPSSSNEMLKTDGETRLTISWSTVAKAERYEVEIYASNAPFTASTEGNLIVSSTTLIATSFTFVPTNRYFGARVRALNSTCASEYSAWSSFAYFQAAVPVNGNVYYDPSGQAALSGSLCTGPTTPMPAEFDALYVSGTNNVPAAGSYPDVTAANPASHTQPGAYSLRLPFSPVGSTGTNLVMFSLPSAELGCTCPAGCTYTGLHAPLSNLNFFVSPSSDPWFQVEGGPVAAYGTLGTVIQSLISPYCQLPGCNPSLILNQNGGDTDGYVLTGGGEIDTAYEAGRQTDQIDENRHNWFAKLSETPEHQDYNYFRILTKLPASPDSDFGTSANNASKPTGEKVNPGAEAYYHDGDLTLNQPWDISADESVIVLVDGDVEVNATTSVAEGGFLMIVTTGDIVFDEELGYDDPAATDAVVEGTFVANGEIRLPSRGEAAGGDRKFVGEGTFVGWSGVVLERDYDDGAGRRRLNNTAPTEFLRYRPDFLKNAPDVIKRSRYRWREINP